MQTSFIHEEKPVVVDYQFAWYGVDHSKMKKFIADHTSNPSNHGVVSEELHEIADNPELIALVNEFKFAPALVTKVTLYSERPASRFAVYDIEKLKTRCQQEADRAIAERIDLDAVLYYIFFGDYEGFV